jgi:hypothetical protein
MRHVSAAWLEVIATRLDHVADNTLDPDETGEAVRQVAALIRAVANHEIEPLEARSKR